MSFWTKSNGEKATGEVKENNFDPIPVSWQTCLLSEVANKEWEDDKYINIKAQIITGEHENRIVFTKLKIYETDNKYYDAAGRDKAIDKFVKLANILKIKMSENEPDDVFLSKFSDKVVDIHFGVWKDQDTKEPKGNFILNFEAKGEKAGTAVASKTPAKAPARPAAKAAAAPAQNSNDMDDDIPF